MYPRYPMLGTQARQNIEEWVVNIARNNVIPAISPKIEKQEINGKTIVIIEVDRGQDKPYQSIDGKYWLRVGSTNRMATKE